VYTTFTNIHVRTCGEVTCSKKTGSYAGGSITTIRFAEVGRHLAEEPEEECPSTKGTWIIWAWVRSLIGVTADIKSWYKLLDFGRRVKYPTPKTFLLPDRS
jgi:hypothetical protein